MSAAQEPTAEQIAWARKFLRFNVELSELNKETAIRIKDLCTNENVSAEIHPDSRPWQWKVLIIRGNIELIEKIEAILGDYETIH